MLHTPFPISPSLAFWQAQVLARVEVSTWLDIPDYARPDLSARDAFCKGMSAGSYADLILDTWIAAEEEADRTARNAPYEAEDQYTQFMEDRADQRADR